MRLCRFVLRLSSPVVTRLLLLLSSLFVLPCNSVFCRPVDLTLLLSLPHLFLPLLLLLLCHLPAAFSAQLTEQTRCHRRRRVPAALPRDLLEVELPGVKCRCSACLSVRCCGSFSRRICGSLSSLHSSGSAAGFFASHHHHLCLSRLRIEGERLPRQQQQQEEEGDGDDDGTVLFLCCHVSNWTNKIKQRLTFRFP